MVMALPSPLNSTKRYSFSRNCRHEFSVVHTLTMFFCTFVEAHKPYQSLMIINIERGKKRPTAHHKLRYKEPKARDGKHKIDNGQREMGLQRKERSAVVLAQL